MKSEEYAAVLQLRFLLFPPSSSSNSYRTGWLWGVLKNGGKKETIGEMNETKKGYWDLMPDAEYQIHLSALRPAT